MKPENVYIYIYIRYFGDDIGQRGFLFPEELLLKTATSKTDWEDLPAGELFWIPKATSQWNRLKGVL